MMIDYAGQQINDLRVLLFERTKHGIRWICECKCGKRLSIPTDKLRKRKGCASCTKRKYVNKRGPEYNVWFNMMDRCYNSENSAYSNYGGRGITVCERWHNFDNFFEDMCPRPSPELTIDREKNWLGYFKENCRWVSMKSQQRNRRDNRLLTFHGETHSMAEWAEKMGLSYANVLKRIQLGWSTERALTAPVRKITR